MGRELTRAELDELLPLYALDALDGDELEQVERYVRTDPAARDEVASLHEAASLLPNPAASAPASLWDRIEGSLTAAPAPAPPLESLLRTGATRPRPVRRRPLLLAAAACVVVVAVGTITALGIKVADQQSRIDNLAALMHHDTMANRAEAAKAMPGAHAIMLTSADGLHSAEVVMLPDGTGYLMHAELPRLSSGRTYQLWAKTGDRETPSMVSAGLLGRDPSVTAFRVTAPVLGFEVTDEATAGAQAPGSSPVVAADMA